MTVYGLWMIMARRRGILFAVRKGCCYWHNERYRGCSCGCQRNHQSSAYSSEYTWPLLTIFSVMCTLIAIAFYIPTMQKLPPSISNFLNVWSFAKKKVEMPPFKAINDGDAIDLGGLMLEVISLPGHTPGGICLLLKEKRILFTGDSINHHLWMQLKESLQLKTFLENLNRISWVTENADRILHGHAQDFDDISLFDDLRSGLKELIEIRGKRRYKI